MRGDLTKGAITYVKSRRLPVSAASKQSGEDGGSTKGVANKETRCAVSPVHNETPATQDTGRTVDRAVVSHRASDGLGVVGVVGDDFHVGSRWFPTLQVCFGLFSFTAYLRGWQGLWVGEALQ